MKTVLFIGVVLLTGVATSAFAGSRNQGYGSNYQSNTVNGHYRSNGTYVQPHQRTNPNTNTHDNYNAQGNYNPYTGRTGRGY
jgi:hypothetical protein